MKSVRRKIWVPCSNLSRSYKEPTRLLQGKFCGYAIERNACQKKGGVLTNANLRHRVVRVVGVPLRHQFVAALTDVVAVFDLAFEFA